MTSKILIEESPVCTGFVWSARYLLFKHIQPKLIYMQYLSEIVLLQDESESN